MMELERANEIIDSAGREEINLGVADAEREKVIEAILTIHGHGVADEEVGNVEWAHGHHIRVGRYIVITGSDGSHHLEDYADEHNAKSEMLDVESDYEDDHDE